MFNQTDDHKVLSSIVDAVADGETVEWEIESEVLNRIRSQVQNLRSLHAIGSLHRSICETGPRAGDEVAPRPRLEPEPDGLKAWGPLEVVRKIGQGSNGAVYLARDPALNREVALKLLAPTEATPSRDVLCEARQLARVRHNNVLTVHGAAEHNGRVGIWTDLVDGQTLGDVVNAHGPLGAREAASIGIDMARALAAVHERGIVHQDVKAANVMRERGGRIVLMDFSSAVSMDEPLSGLSGTALYMAPELFQGRTAQIVSDVYSLGVLLYYLVTARFPVEGESVGDLMEHHAHGHARPLRDWRPDLPGWLVSAIEKALAKDPTQRFESMGEMERAFMASPLPDPDEDSHSVHPSPSPSRGQSSNLWIRGIAAVLVAVVLGWVGWKVWGSSDLHVEATLFRFVDDVEQRLISGNSVELGDQLFLELQGNEEMYVYVFNEDETGSAFLLFPLPSLDQSNPLPRAAHHRLPGTVGGIEKYWDVTTAGVKETIYIVASSKPLPALEAQLQALSESFASAAPVERDVLDPVLRGLGGLSSRNQAAGTTHRFSDTFESLAKQAELSEGLTTWRTRLWNAGD